MSVSVTVSDSMLDRALSKVFSILTPAAVITQGNALSATIGSQVLTQPAAVVVALNNFSNAVKSSPVTDAQIAQWVDFAKASTDRPSKDVLVDLESSLKSSSYLAGQGFSAADVVLLSLVAENKEFDASKYPAITRWATQVLNEPGKNIRSVFSSIAIPEAAALKVEFAAPKKEKEKKAKAPVEEKPEPTPLSECEIKVGKIVEVWKHPESDKLYCEKIDLGEESGPRQIASGLAPHFTLEQMQNRRVVVASNLKPRPLANFVSAGMVLCATNADGVVRFVEPPEGAPVGERITFAGHEGVPAAEPNRMAKKKLFDLVAPGFKVDDKLVATWNGIPFNTSAGPCTVEGENMVGSSIH